MEYRGSKGERKKYKWINRKKEKRGSVGKEDGEW